MTVESITPSSGNVFADLGFSPKEAALLKLHAQLMADLRETLAARGWTQTQVAQALGVSQSRISDLVRGKWQQFSLDMLITLAVRAGRQVHVELTSA